jgi:hypothetical protein
MPKIRNSDPGRILYSKQKTVIATKYIAGKRRAKKREE